MKIRRTGERPHPEPIPPLPRSPKNKKKNSRGREEIESRPVGTRWDRSAAASAPSDSMCPRVRPPSPVWGEITIDIVCVGVESCGEVSETA